MLKTSRLILIVFIASAIGCKNNNVPDISKLDREDFFYAADETGNFEVWHWQNGTKEQLTSYNERNNFWPRSNPDRTQVLFLSTPAEDDIQDIKQSEIRILSVATGTMNTIFESDTALWKIHASPSWSNNGDRFVFSGKKNDTTTWQLVVCDANGENANLVSTRSQYNHFDPVFTSNDSIIICAIAPTDESPESENLELFALNISTGEETRLTYNNTRDQGPSLNRLGDKIIFESLVNPNYLSIGKWAIRELDLNTGEVATIIEDMHLNLAPRFGQKDSIYFIKLDITEFKTGLYKYDPSDKSAHPLIQEEFNALNIDPK